MVRNSLKKVLSQYYSNKENKKEKETISLEKEKDEMLFAKKSFCKMKNLQKKLENSYSELQEKK